MSNNNIDPFSQVTMKQSALKIILVDENMGRSAILRRALQDKGMKLSVVLKEALILPTVMKLPMQMWLLLMQIFQMKRFLLT